MKRTLLAIALLASFAVLPTKAAPFWYDVITNYAGGCITTNTANWFPHPPGSGLDALIITNTYFSGAAVNGKRLRVNGLNSEYIERWLDLSGGTTNTYGSGALWVSFIANANFVPAFGGTYFAHLMDGGSPLGETNAFEFRGRIFELATTNTFPFTNTVTGTYQYGVANAANDLTASGGGPILTVPIDLVRNVDYQVVMKYDLDNITATIWVNPASESDIANSSGPASDIGALTNTLAALGFRQRTGGGTVDIRDVAVGLAFADVMTNSTPGPVLVATNFNTVTNYAGNAGFLEVFASSIGGGVLSYQWYQISGGATNPVGGSSQKYIVSSLAGSDTGNYFCAVTNSGGVGEVSRTNFYISVNTASTPPTFTTKPPAATNGSIGGKLTLTCAAFGTGPLSFQWALNSNPLVDGQPATGNAGDQSVVSGSQKPTLVVTGLSTNETGNFSVTVTGGVSPATNATTAVTVNPARLVDIAYLRSLEDHTTWQATDTGSVFALSNCVVTMFTNVTSGTTASYYIQDATAGIDLFVTGDASFRPQLGDIVKASGTLSMFNNVLELAIDSSNPYQYYSVIGHTNLLPAPVVFGPLSLTNNASLMETNIEGRIIMITNVGFTGALTTGAGNTSLFVTNADSSVPFQIFFPAGTDPDVASKTLSSRFAWTITGVMAQFKSGAYSAAGYELYVTRIGDILTNPPPAVTAAVTVSGNSASLNWEAVPYTIDARGAYSYSVLAANDVAGPYVPLATGLAFNTANGTYTDTGAQTYEAVLAGTNEVGPNSSTASGLGYVVLSPDQSTITVNEKFTGLSAPASASHIHGPAGAGTNAPVLFPFAGVPAATAGAIPQQSFAITPTQLGYLTNGLLYMNVHDATYPGGEIRAQLVPATTKFYKVASP